MYGEYSEEVLARKLDDSYAYDGRFVTQRLHVGANCKCVGQVHVGHHQTVPDPGDSGAQEPPPEESMDLAQARKESHVRHKKHGED